MPASYKSWTVKIRLFDNVGAILYLESENMNNVYSIELPDGLTQEACLEKLFELFKSDISDDTLQNLVEAVYLREDTSSTYVGNGLAVPHGRVENFGAARVAFGVSRIGVDWPSDDCKANVVALIGVDKKDVSKYLSILQKISKWKKQNPAIFAACDFEAIKNSIESSIQI